MKRIAVVLLALAFISFVSFCGISFAESGKKPAVISCKQEIWEISV